MATRPSLRMRPGSNGTSVRCGMKSGERKPDRPPARLRQKGLTVGLPGPAQLRCAKMQAIGLAIARHLDLEPGKPAAVDRAARWIEVERHLDEAAVVLQRDLTLHADRHAAGDAFAASAARRRHHPSPGRTAVPSASRCGFRKAPREVVDDGEGHVHGVPQRPASVTAAVFPEQASAPRVLWRKECPMEESKPGKAPNADQLRAAIDSGKTGDKVAFPDPAAAPLGTDAEAAGAPPASDELHQAFTAETGSTCRRGPATGPRSAYGPWLSWLDRRRGRHHIFHLRCLTDLERRRCDPAENRS